MYTYIHQSRLLSEFETFDLLLFPFTSRKTNISTSTHGKTLCTELSNECLCENRIVLIVD